MIYIILIDGSCWCVVLGNVNNFLGARTVKGHNG